MTCDKHRKEPARGYSECAGCEVERLNAELARLRSVNEELVRALKGCVSWMEEHHQMPSYSEKIYIARAAISRAEQAKPTLDLTKAEWTDEERASIEQKPETCVWKYEEAWVSGCGLQYINAVIDADMKFCPFCGKRVEVKK